MSGYLVDSMIWLTTGIGLGLMFRGIRSRVRRYIQRAA